MRSSSSWVALGLLLMACSPRASSSSSSEALPSLRAPEAAPSSAGKGSGGPASGTAGGAAASAAASGSTATGSTSEPGAEGGNGAPLQGLPLGAGGAPADASAPPLTGSAGGPQQSPRSVAQPAPERLESVLVFTRTTGFRHDSIGPGIAALQQLGSQNGFAVANTEDPADFNDQNLARYDVVVWLNTDSEVLNDGARRAFERYIQGGGGWVGVHAAAASEYGWSWYGQLLGAYFLGHPAVQPARVQVESADHPSTAQLPQSFTVQDEWYSFRTNPRASTTVLMTLDESSYGVGDLAMGDHPIAWYHEFDGGRAWYTALGHPSESYSNPIFLSHLLGGIRWAAGASS